MPRFEDSEASSQLTHSHPRARTSVNNPTSGSRQVSTPTASTRTPSAWESSEADRNTDHTHHLTQRLRHSFCSSFRQSNNSTGPSTTYRSPSALVNHHQHSAIKFHPANYPHLPQDVQILRSPPPLRPHQDRLRRLLPSRRFGAEAVRQRRDLGDRQDRKGLRSLLRGARAHHASFQGRRWSTEEDH